MHWLSFVFLENRFTIRVYRIWTENGIRDGNSHQICGPGWPGTPQKAEFVDSEQNPRTGCYYYFIKKTVFEEIILQSYQNHNPPCPK